MSINELIPLCIAVISDWRVIFITVLTIVFIALAKYVQRYRKKPPRVRVKKAETKAPAEKAAPAEGEAASEDKADAAK